MGLVRRLARPMMSGIFVYGGLDTFRHPGSRVSQAEPFLHKVAPALRLPDDPELLVRANAAAQVGAGLMLGLGRLPRLSATVLALSTAPTTVAGHAFWKTEDPSQAKAQRVQFLKNLNMLGGLMIAAADTQGKPSLGWRAERAAKKTQKAGRKAAKSTKKKLPKS